MGQANHDFRKNEREMFLRARLKRAIGLKGLVKFDSSRWLVFSDERR
jgi:hypothetical protein